MTTTASIEERLTMVEGAVQDLRAEQRQTNARLDALETAVQELRAEQRQTNTRLDAVESRLGALAERTCHYRRAG